MQPTQKPYFPSPLKAHLIAPIHLQYWMILDQLTIDLKYCNIHLGTAGVGMRVGAIG